MNILLTGNPEVGKSTLLDAVVGTIPYRQGFLTREVREGKDRTGFTVVSALGTSTLLASTRSDSPVRVSRYGVELDAFEKFLGQLPAVNPGSLLYLDEIGEMQLASPAFIELAEDYLAAPNHLIGTLTSVYTDGFVEDLRRREDTKVLEVTTGNRDMLKDVLVRSVAQLTRR